MIFEALPARYGDCLILTIEKGSKVVRLLVDGGPPSVFANTLEPHLQALRDELQMEDDDPLPIEAVMVSHVDEDHIAGILDMFGTMNDADHDSRPRLYDVKYLLHNSLDSLMAEGEGGAARALKKNTVLAGFGVEGVPFAPSAISDELAMKVLQSYPQGSRLATLSAALQINRNPPDQRTILFGTKKPRVLRMGDATILIVGPLQAEVDKLRHEWSTYKKGKKTDEALAAYLDTSAQNLSSIVALVECRGKTVLLTGDARGDKIKDGLDAAGLLDNGPLKVDILKLPHHGSARNVEVEFFRDVVHAKHYIASGDGTHGNPDREMFEMLAAARPNAKLDIHLTYTPTSIDRTHRDWCAASPKKRGVYSPAKHSLVGLFKSWKNNESRFTVHMDGHIALDLG